MLLDTLSVAFSYASPSAPGGLPKRMYNIRYGAGTGSLVPYIASALYMYVHNSLVSIFFCVIAHVKTRHGLKVGCTLGCALLTLAIPTSARTFYGDKPNGLRCIYTGRLLANYSRDVPILWTFRIFSSTAHYEAYYSCYIYPRPRCSLCCSNYRSATSSPVYRRVWQLPR